MARADILRNFGFSQQNLSLEGIFFIVHSVEAKFLKPAKLDDEITVETYIVEKKPASVLFYQNIKIGEVDIFKVNSRIACINNKNNIISPQKIPPEIVKSLLS